MSFSQTPLTLTDAFITRKATWKLAAWKREGIDKKYPGEFINSPEFDVGPAKWSLRLYPAGHDAAGGNCAIYIVLSPNSIKSDTVAKYRFHLMNQKLLQNDRSNFHHSPFPPTGDFMVRTFTPNIAEQVFGFPTAWKRSEMMDSKRGFYQGDSLLIEVEVFVAVGAEQQAPRENPQLQVELEGLFNSASSMYSDAVLLIRKTVAPGVPEKVLLASIPVHRGILAARSKVFRDIFVQAQKASPSNSVNLDDCGSPSALRLLLLYIYTGQVKATTWDEAAGLIQASSMFQVEPLKKACEPLLLKFLTAMNVSATLALIDQHNLNKALKAKCEPILLQALTVTNLTDMYTVAEKHGFNDLKNACVTLAAKSPESMLKLLSRTPTAATPTAAAASASSAPSPPAPAAPVLSSPQPVSSSSSSAAPAAEHQSETPDASSSSAAAVSAPAPAAAASPSSSSSSSLAMPALSPHSSFSSSASASSSHSAFADSSSSLSSDAAASSSSASSADVSAPELPVTGVKRPLDESDEEEEEDSMQSPAKKARKS